MNKKGFKHWNRGVFHSLISYTDCKSSQKILGFLLDFSDFFRIFRNFFLVYEDFINKKGFEH